MIQLGVNIDHVATLRQVRGGRYPDPVAAAEAAERGGADGITVHLREDRRHIQERDVALLRETVQTKINLEMAAIPSMVDFARRWSPADVCLVPEKRHELTTEGGLEVAGAVDHLREIIASLTGSGIRVSLFIDPSLAQVEAAVRVGAPVVELHTGRYAEAVGGAARKAALRDLREAARRAMELGLVVHAGHGLNYHNVQPVAAIAGIRELNIGHAIIARAIFSGLEGAVATMKRLMREAAGGCGPTA
ncbi:MAG: pyridoxine 5'-phosphate synthase [Magnetococcales bacterium]|nr:pyridoxine 5'-phosphate synthase [Magnetococcales bacterium]MBF0155925.1 pyridoxine 5'-phosphate synthase [Magnetococcales bacterium]